MRWPLRRQILWPLVGLLLTTMIVVSGLNAWLATRRIERQIESQLRDVVTTLSTSNFPLEAPVLKQMRGFTSAEYVVSQATGRVLAASEERFSNLIPATAILTSQPHLSQTVLVDERPYFYVPAILDRRAVGGERLTLHIFYPEAVWQDARRDAILTPLLIGAVAIAAASLFAYAIAAHVTRPVQQLQRQVEQIAGGDFQPLALPARDDEIRDLALAVNQMAGMLVSYESHLRTNERLRTLGQLGGGIAHQVRNAATGCRIALDLHERDCPLAHTNGTSNGDSHDETLQIAVQQLALIETHVQRFLTLGRKSATPKRAVSLSQIIEAAVPLVRPMAEHVGVQLELPQNAASEQIQGDLEALQQLLINLLLNGIEAAAHARAISTGATPAPARVAIEVRNVLAGYELAVGDTGAGPAEEMQGRLFEPFATDKPQGTGLGLSVVRQIATDHGGNVRWERKSGLTWFIVELPKNAEG